MKDTKKQPRSRATKRAKRTDRGVAFDEMLRLMRIYGSVKCLRKRQTPDEGGETYTKTKIESIKRKFYRWFPDLDERFTKDENGMYWPNCGHEGEILYREEMRKLDGEILITKRVTCRRDRHGTSIGKSRTTSSESKVATTDRESGEAETNLTLNGNSDPIDSFSSVDIEPIDCSFLSEHGILDDFDSSFYDLPTAVSLSRSFSTHDSTATSSSNSSWESEVPLFIDDNLAKSVEGYDEFLSSDDGDSVSGDLFDLVSDGTDHDSLDDLSAVLCDDVLCSDDSCNCVSG